MGLSFAPASYGDISAKLSQGALVCAICGEPFQGCSLLTVYRDVAKVVPHSYASRGLCAFSGKYTTAGDSVAAACCMADLHELSSSSDRQRSYRYEYMYRHERMSLLAAGSDA